MDISDIPDQITKSFRYSLRSPGTFFLSLITALVVFGLAYDLIYGFWYTRWYNLKDAQYEWPYFAGLFFVSVVIPVAIGVGAYIRARALERPFDAGQIGIAIAPFEVISVDPETLGTASALQALDIVTTQFFFLVQNLLREYPLAEEFKFRFLPQYTKITNKQQALQHVSDLRATLVIWGRITQRSRQPLEIRLEMQAAEQTYIFSNLSIEEFPMLPLQHFIFVEAAKIARRRGNIDYAQHLDEQARPLSERLHKEHPEMDSAGPRDARE